MKPISEFGLAAAVALAGGAALAQDFTAGKTPAQLFGSDCSACHRSPGGLGKSRDVRALTAFLTEHYTTKPETAGALAAYVSGFTGTGVDPRGRPAVASPPPAITGGDTLRSAAKPAADPRRRRELEMSSDGEKASRRRDERIESPRPPPSNAVLAATPGPSAAPRPPERPAASPKLMSPAEAAASLPPPTSDPQARLRAYATSGLALEAVAAEAARPRSGATGGSGEGSPAANKATVAPSGEGRPAASRPPLPGG